jgi:hypothetical protein
VVRVDKSQMVTLRNSIAWPGTDVFLSLAPGLKVAMIGNELGAAKAASREEAGDYWKGINTPDRR